jgi:gas vesicle protein
MSIAPPAPTTSTPLPAPTSSVAPHASPVQDDLFERVAPSAYRIQEVTDNKDFFHTISIIRHNYVGNVDEMSEELSKAVEKYAEQFRTYVLEKNDNLAEGTKRLAKRLAYKDKDENYWVEAEILQMALERAYIIIYEPATSTNDARYSIITPNPHSSQDTIFLRYVNGCYQPFVFKVNNKWQHRIPVEVKCEAPFDIIFKTFPTLRYIPPIAPPAPTMSIAPPAPTTSTPLPAPTSSVAPHASPVQDDLFERVAPSAYRIQEVTDNKDFFHTISIIRHNYVGNVDEMSEELSKAVEKYAEQFRTYVLEKNDNLAEGTKRLAKRLAYKDKDENYWVEAEILQMALERAYIIIYEPATSTNDARYSIITPNPHSSQDTIFLRYVNGCYQPFVFKVNNKWQHRIPVEVKCEAPFDIIFKTFPTLRYIPPIAPPVARETPDIPTRSDPLFEALVLVPRSAYRIQSVPGDGNCFFYAIALYVLNFNDLTGVPRPVPQNIVDKMIFLRKRTASEIYEHPRYLEELYVRNLDDDHVKLPPRSTYTGKPDKNAFIDHFLTKSPYADDVEIRVMQEDIAVKNVAVVIYDPSSIQQFRSYNCVVPETVESIIVVKLDYEHYEPIIFHVDGNWQHTIPIGMKDSATYGKLFESIAEMWTDFGIKIFPERKILQRIAQLEEEIRKEKATKRYKIRQEMASEDGSTKPPVSPWWRRPTSSM